MSNEIIDSGSYQNYAARGWIIHRVQSPTAKVNSPGKQPVDAGWQKVTTPPTEATLKQWFGSDNPNRYNVGLLCGEASGVTVIDLDRMIYADIFNGVDTLRSSRTAGRGHVYFKYNPRLKASKHHNLGIEVLATGNNVILPPSVHEAGGVYKWDDPDAPLAEMPEEIEVKLINLFKREKELNALVKKCRPCFSRLFKKEIREVTDFHGAEGRELMVAWGTDLKAAGATLADGEMWVKIIYGDGFDRAKTLTEWRNIDPTKTWKCETVGVKFGCDCAGCNWRAAQTPKKAHTTKYNKDTASPDMFLIGDKEAFDANGFSKWLLNGSGFTFATLPGDDDMMWYREGVYIRGGDIEIKKVIEEIMDGFKVTTHAVNEVIGHVQRRTYTESGEFDKDKHIINLKNGLYNTETSELIPHAPEYLSTVQIPVEHNGDATCPVIDQFLTDVLDDEDIGAAMEWFGYLLEPHYWIQKMLMLLGEGSNGKSKFLGLLSAFIGKKNISNESIQDLSNNRFRVANLHGKLANIHADISSRALHDTGILKLLSGGDDVSVEKKNKSSFEFENFARMVFSANRLPHAEDDTDAWYRRWTFINFTRKFGDDPDAVGKADKRILEKLTVDSELSGLLNRALVALKGLHDRDGFQDNMSTEDTRAIYRRLSDPVATFIEDCCILGSDNKVGRAALFRAYVLYCDVNRQAVLGQSAFVRRIKDMGVFSDCQVGNKGNQERGFRGVNIDSSIMDSMNKTTLNINETIFNDSGNTLGNTLWENEKTLTVDSGNTLNTAEKTILGSGRKKGVKCKSGAQDAKTSVISVLPEPTDSDNRVCESVLPSVLPDLMEGISQGTKAMLFIAECHKRYNIETDHAFNVITAKLEDQGYDQKLIDHCVTRYRQGHRVHIPMPGCETP